MFPGYLSKDGNCPEKEVNKPCDSASPSVSSMADMTDTVKETDSAMYSSEMGTTETEDDDTDNSSIISSLSTDTDLFRPISLPSGCDEPFRQPVVPATHTDKRNGWEIMSRQNNWLTTGD